MMRYEQTDEFKRDFKRLAGKYRSLEDDLNTAKINAIELRYERSIDNAAIFEIQGFCSAKIKIAKIKKFACKSLSGTGSRSGIRVIFAFIPEEALVIFIEIYYKGEQASEDRDRIKDFLSSKKMPP